MNQMILVGIGGFLGAVARFKLGGYIMHATSGGRFPLSTFVVNVSGCLMAGILAGLIEKRDIFSSNIRLFLLTGILGGFTTFSAFGLETVLLFQRQQTGAALTYAGASMVFGIAALWLGVKIVS